MFINIKGEFISKKSFLIYNMDCIFEGDNKIDC